MAAAAAAEAGSLFDFFRAVPECAQAAKGRSPSPRYLAQLPPGRLAALHRTGVDIGAVDANGENVLHHWCDHYDLRQGWKTICALRPDLLEQKNKNGLTPDQKAVKELFSQPKKDAARQAVHLFC